MTNGNGPGPRPDPRIQRRGQGELEALVLSALRAAARPVTAHRVRQDLGEELAYSTVMTILSRLLAKQAVTRERIGRAYLWSPKADVAGLAALQMRRVLDGRPDREAVLTSFVSTLPPDDERLLRGLLGPDQPEE